MRLPNSTSATLAAFLLMLAPSAATAGGIETAGDVLKYAMPLGAAGISFAKEDPGGALELGVAYAGAMGTALALKSVVREWRPDRSDRRSFPSDSATSAFASAAYLDKRYGWHYGLPAYALAAFVGYSRVEADEHHWHDVAAGALLGWTANQLVTTRFGAARIQPLVSTDAIGLNLDLRW